MNSRCTVVYGVPGLGRVKETYPLDTDEQHDQLDDVIRLNQANGCAIYSMLYYSDDKDQAPCK